VIKIVLALYLLMQERSEINTNMDPRIEYARRIEQRRITEDCRESWHHRIGNSRLAVFLAATVMAWLAFWSRVLSPWWLLAPAFIFFALVIWHGRVLQQLQQCRRSIEFFKNGISRLNEQWENIGEPGDRFEDPSHPYAKDLDLFGKRSLFQLLCNARTHAGEEKLASWLKTPASLDEIHSRQAAVGELRSNLDLREDLAVLGADVGAGVEPYPLLKWAQSPIALRSISVRILAALIALSTTASLVIWGITGQHFWFFLMILIEVIFVFSLRRTVHPAVSGAEKACQDLQLLSHVLGRLEKERFETDQLKKLRIALNHEGFASSRLIARLSFLIVLLDSRRNQLFAPFAFILLWEIHLAFFIEDWRKKYGHAIAGWLEATAEIEALSSLAGYAYEHPNDPFAELSEQSPCFEGRDLGHPLLPEAKCVRNDVSLMNEARVLVVSGSNMSGKSTLLRTIGVNAVLALAGAPVRAKYLRIAPLALGASIRIMDSLQEGTSRFYAEITRLKQLVTIAEGPIPLMFLLDELLHGTNSHDRRIGAEAVIKGLVQRGAIGLLTTHDLALAHIVDALAPHAANVHFEDHIENGRIAFDYHLRPGIVKKSNALELMRSIGLEV
jgi:hypothetical protein